MEGPAEGDLRHAQQPRLMERRLITTCISTISPPELRYRAQPRPISAISAARSRLRLRRQRHEPQHEQRAHPRRRRRDERSEVHEVQHGGRRGVSERGDGVGDGRALGDRTDEACELGPRYARDPPEIWPRSARDSAEMWPRWRASVVERNDRREDRADLRAERASDERRHAERRAAR